TEEEPDETFFLCMTNVLNATVARACGIGTIINNDTNQPPAVSLAAAAPCLELPANLDVLAFAIDVDGFVAAVEFYDNSTMVAIALGNPFGFTWFNVPPGLHVLTAVARSEERR